MPLKPGDPADVARAIADLLEREQTPYALGGALAYNYYGAFRATVDVDFNVFLPPAEARAVLTNLQKEGLEINIEESLARVNDGRHAVGTIGGMHVDLFFNSIPLHESASGRVVRRDLAARPIRILSAEDLVLLKLLFFRGKDKTDIERVVQRVGNAMDRQYVREWIVEMMGEEDERVRVWDRYCRELPGI